MVLAYTKKYRFLAKKSDSNLILGCSLRQKKENEKGKNKQRYLGQYRTIPALRLKHRSGGCGTASALPKYSIMSGCGTRIVLRGQKPLTLCDRCPCFGSLFPPLAALTFAASSIICAFGLAATAPRSPYRHLELCGIAISLFRINFPNINNHSAAGPVFSWSCGGVFIL